MLKYILSASLIVSLAQISAAQTPENKHKTVDPTDVVATPSKWKERDIEFKNVQVYWVGDDDIRLITPANLTIFVKKAKSTDADYFKKNCETAKEALSRQCRAAVKFSYISYDTDSPSGFSKRTVVVSNDAEIMRPQQQKRK